MKKIVGVIAVLFLLSITISLVFLVSQRSSIAPTVPQQRPKATDGGEPTATSGTLEFVEGKTTYDCSNPSEVTRHITISTIPSGTSVRLRVTSYVDVYTPRIEERVIFDDLVTDGQTVAVTMTETPPSGFGNVHFAATLYFADGSFIPYGSDANVGWPHCPTPTAGPSPMPTLTPNISIHPTNTVTPTPRIVQCTNISVYQIINGSWIKVTNLNTLLPGTSITIVFGGTSSLSTYDKVRIQLNGGNWIEGTERDPQGNLTVTTLLPSSVESISLQGQIHDVQYGWF